MQIIPLSEGSFTIDASKVFIPFNASIDDLQKRPAGSLLVEIQPFLVITASDVILIDTGLGFELSNGIMQIHQNLLNNEVDPASVTKVLVSHLHKDHAGGIMHLGKPAFENALYYINKNEMDFALQKGPPSYQTRDFEKLPLFNNVQWISGEGKIDDHIRFETCGGHCPFHMVFWIQEKDEIVFFGGDVAPQLQQMKTRFIAKYDNEPRKSMELRSKWWQMGKENNWKMLFYHDITHPYISLK